MNTFQYNILEKNKTQENNPRFVNDFAVLLDNEVIFLRKKQNIRISIKSIKKIRVLKKRVDFYNNIMFIIFITSISLFSFLNLTLFEKIIICIISFFFLFLAFVINVKEYKILVNYDGNNFNTIEIKNKQKEEAKRIVNFINQKLISQ